MSLRHTAALMLVGWYLMYPPMTPNGKTNLPNAPLTQWQTGGSFDTAKECEAARRGVRKGEKIFGSGLGENLGFAQCVSTDDPRLKER